MAAIGLAWAAAAAAAADGVVVVERRLVVVPSATSCRPADRAAAAAVDTSWADWVAAVAVVVASVT